MAFWTQIKLTSSSGGSVTILLPVTGTVDDTNKDFGFSSKPSVIVVNGAAYRENHGWSWNSGTLTATLDYPVGVNGDIYALQ